MVINVKFEFDESELKALKSHLAGQPRTSKVTRTEFKAWLEGYVKQVIANAPRKV